MNWLWRLLGSVVLRCDLPLGWATRAGSDLRYGWRSAAIPGGDGDFLVAQESCRVLIDWLNTRQVLHAGSDLIIVRDATSTNLKVHDEP